MNLTDRLQSVVNVLRKIQGILLWVITAYIAFTFIKNGILKFDPEGFWGPAFERWGFPVWFLFLVGFLETAGGILIVIPVPKIRFFGGITIGVVMMGAFITRLIHGMSFDDAIFIFFASMVSFYVASLTQFRKAEQTG